MYGYVNLADKGYGSGQILAILLKIIVSSRSANNQRKFKTVNSILVLEEPESNLHPDFQAKLIDMLWDAQQKFNIRFIIECHSEYMIRRLQVLVKNKDLKPDQISIAYFNEAEINQIRISDNGFLDKQIPTGFMDIAAQMAIEIL
jgi:predicted ATPase